MTEEIKENSVNPILRKLEDLLKLLEEEEFEDPIFGGRFSLHRYVAPGKHLYFNTGIEALRMSEWENSPYKEYLASCSIILIESLRKLSQDVDERREIIDEYARQMQAYQTYVQSYRTVLEEYKRKNCFRQIFTRPKFPVPVKKPLLKDFNIGPEINYSLPCVLSPLGLPFRIGRYDDTFGSDSFLMIKFRSLAIPLILTD